MYRVYWMDGMTPRTVLLSVEHRDAVRIAKEISKYGKLTVYVEKVF